MARKPDSRVPPLDRDAVVDAAIALVRREGFAALSMRRVAADLGVGTMSLYWHVATRDDLIELMFDRAIAGQVVTALSADWREALTQIARATYAAFSANLWLKDTPFPRRLGAAVVEHADQSIAAVEGIDLPLVHRMAIVSVVDSYVRGWVLDHSVEPEGPMAVPELTDEAAARLAAGDYPRFAAMTTVDWTAAEWRASQDFEVGLAVVLDGIGVAVAQGRMPAMPVTSP